MPWYNVGDVGKRVSASLSDGGKIEGWLYGEIPQGILIAEDTEGSRLRLLQKGSWTSMGIRMLLVRVSLPLTWIRLTNKSTILTKSCNPEWK